MQLLTELSDIWQLTVQTFGNFWLFRYLTLHLSVVTFVHLYKFVRLTLSLNRSSLQCVMTRFVGLHCHWHLISLSVLWISTDSCSLKNFDNKVINLLLASLQAKTVICGWLFYLYNWQTLVWTCHFFWHFMIEHSQVTLQFTVKCSCVSIVQCLTVKWHYSQVFLH